MQRSGPKCSIQECIQGAMPSANASEPMGTALVCQSNPMRGMPRPPSLRVILGQAATAAIPACHTARTSSSRLAYRPTRLSAPMWFRMMGNSGTARAKAATSGIWGKRDHDIDGQPLAAQDLCPFPKGRVGQDALTLPVVYRGVGTPGDVVPDAPKPVGAGHL